MSITDDVLAQPAGATFIRADLHIHSFGASHDVRDATMTPSAIVTTAEKEGLAIIAITDHNEITNVEAALNATLVSSVLVIPGIELSTPQGHLLCYLPTLDALRRLHGQLSIVDRGKPNSRCQQSLLECLNLLRPLNGFGVLAHVDIPSGFEIEVPGASPHKADILCHSALLGIELKQATSDIAYSDTDPVTERAQMGRERILRLSLGTKQHLARVLNSDAHALRGLGRNAATLRRVTRYKMDAPSFDGLRLALEDADARVRIEDQVPETTPMILGVHLDGGFLSGQVLQFSPNLNCLIGGRGTGKSTIFETVRCITGSDSDNKVIDSEVWPEDLHLLWKDQAGQTSCLRRQRECAITNVDDDVFGPNGFEVDCFGQGEAARISVESQTDPLTLLRYLDRFVDLRDLVAAEEKTREKLLEEQSAIEKAEQQVQLIPQYERSLATTRQQLTALQKPEVKELITLQRHLATEKELRTQIAAKLRAAKDSAKEGSPKVAIEAIADLADPRSVTVGVAEFRTILDGSRELSTQIANAQTQVKTGLSEFETIVSAQIASWKLKESEAQKRVDAKRKELEALKIALDMSYLTKLTKDEATYQQDLKNLQAWRAHLVELRKQRTATLKERWAARERIAEARSAFGRRATQILSESLADLQVSLKYSHSAHSPDAATQIIEAMGWRTNQQPRAAYLVEQMTVPVLLEAIVQKKRAPIMGIKTPEGVQVFERKEADLILEKLSQPTIQYALERATIHDLPRLQLTRAVPDGKGGKRHVVRDFAKLSLGQQQSVLLALVLSSDSNRPLIIDQPEDNLDGEFIYSTLVPVLRRAKERRQVIIVTHNANVAVLGDAELIIVMKAMHDRGEVVARGSIDSPPIRAAACAILEGAKEAFIRRAKVYGVNPGNTT